MFMRMFFSLFLSFCFLPKIGNPKMPALCTVITLKVITSRIVCAEALLRDRIVFLLGRKWNIFESVVLSSNDDINVNFMRLSHSNRRLQFHKYAIKCVRKCENNARQRIIFEFSVEFWLWQRFENAECGFLRKWFLFR